MVPAYPGDISLLTASPPPSPDVQVEHWLAGCDPSPGIVSVQASLSGVARVWRRLPDDAVEMEEVRFPTWFLTNSLELLEHLPLQWLQAGDLRAAHGGLPPPPSATVQVVPLEGGGSDAFRYLVLARSLADLEPALLERLGKQLGQPVARMADLRDRVLLLPPAEQYLLLSGRTYYKDLPYGRLRRLQFDLETTGLSQQSDRIFMVSLRDSTGWRACLDTATQSEARLLGQFVELVRERDPDVLENHNVFSFDIPFLVRRAQHLGVSMALGRDGSDPVSAPDVLRVSDRDEPFTRWSVAGREVIDTLHAVKRHAASTRDLRRLGLKDAARYFGFAKTDREYVPGAEIWRTFQRDPDRVRRYAQDDVEEADGLSRRLLPGPYALARLTPRAYERIATDTTPAGLLDPLLLRAYLHEASAVPRPPAPRPRHAAAAGARRTQLFVTGVVSNAARITLVGAEAHVAATRRITPAADQLGAFPHLLGALLSEGAVADDGRAEACELLASLTQPYLAGGGALLPDPGAAASLVAESTRLVDAFVGRLRAAGATALEVDGERVVFGMPEGWDEREERALLATASAGLPPAVRPRQEGRYRAIYAPAARSCAVLLHDGTVTLIGDTFRRGGQERYGEQFIRAAAPLVLEGRSLALRRLFTDTVARLRAHQVSPEDLCTRVTLHRSSAEYGRATRPEEPYEVLLRAGVKQWRAGHRVRYFRDRTGAMRLLVDGDGTLAAEVDAEYYVRRLRAAYCQPFAQAFRPEDVLLLFRVPDARMEDLFETYDDERMAAIRPISRPLPA